MLGFESSPRQRKKICLFRLKILNISAELGLKVQQEEKLIKNAGIYPSRFVLLITHKTFRNECLILVENTRSRILGDEFIYSTNYLIGSHWRFFLFFF